MGGCAIDAVGEVHPDGTAEACKGLRRSPPGRCGRPQVGTRLRPGEASGDRPAVHPQGPGPCTPICVPPSCARHGGRLPLKKETAEKGIDLMMVRELTGGIYFRKAGALSDRGQGEEAADRMAYSPAGDRAHRPPCL